MAFAVGKSSVNLEDITSRVTEANILSFYLGINKVPCIINSPLREDKKPSFGLYSLDGKRIYFTDLSRGDRGGIIDLLSQLWNTDYNSTLQKIYEDIPKMNSSINVKLNKTSIETIHNTSNSIIQCKIRKWRQYDIEYWNSYGISLKWLKYAEVYPISHKIIIKNNHRYVLPADKLAYAYVEHKDKKTTLKIYQPLNVEGYKWSNNHNSSVISLWTKVPKYGDKICICSSLKDALCLFANTGIPAIATQGEGYKISNTAINELKKRYKEIYILFDNDEAGLIDGKKLSESTGFINLVLPNQYGEKDISDLYKSLHDKNKFKKIILNLFNNNLKH